MFPTFKLLKLCDGIEAQLEELGTYKAVRLFHILWRVFKMNIVDGGERIFNSSYGHEIILNQILKNFEELCKRYI